MLIEITSEWTRNPPFKLSKFEGILFIYVILATFSEEIKLLDCCACEMVGTFM